MSIEGQDAAAALASVRETRQKFGESLQCGWDYSFAFGGLMGWLIAIQGAPTPWRFAGFAPFFLALPLMLRWQRRSTGRFINGYRRGRTRWVAIGMFVMFMALYGLANWFALVARLPWASVPLGLLAVPLGAVANRIWVRAYNLDMAADR